MSASENIEFELGKAVCDAFTASMPAGLPEGIVVVQGIHQGEKVQPRIVVRCEGGQWPHPKMYAGELVMELDVNPADVPDEATFAAWGAKMEQGLLQRGLVIKAALAAKGLGLAHVMPIGTSDVPEERAGYVAERRWGVRVRTSAGGGVPA